MRIPFVDLKSAIADTELSWRANLEELHNRSSYILGHQVEKFEKEFAAAMGARYAVGVGSGCGAIEICLRASDVTREKQEVLTSALTAPFTAVAIQAAGATPVFADIDPETLLMDPDDAGNRMSRRVAAVVPVHLYGQVCRAGQFRAPVVQDACQAHGAGEFTRYSPYVAYSFYPTKNLGALGDGGAIATDSLTVVRRVREIRDGGRRGGQVSYVRGINSRLDEMQACYLRAFLPRLEAWNTRRRQIAAMYDERLAGVPGVHLVRRIAPSVCHLYVIRAKRRDAVREYLAKQGIATGVHYPAPLHLHPAFAGKLKRGDLPHAEKACREIVSLPIGPYFPDSAIEEVADAVNKFYA